MDEGYGKPLGHPVISTENHAAQLDGLDEVLHGHLCRFLLQRLNADRQHLKQDCYGADHSGKFWPSVGWLHLRRQLHDHKKPHRQRPAIRSELLDPQGHARNGNCKNGASISNYTASCNGLSSSNTTGSALSVGKIAKSGNVTVTLTVTDSRGYTASVSQTITVIPYAKPKVSSVTLRRTNDIEAEMQLRFSGSISAVTVDGTQKNSVVYVRYRYKKTSESSYGSYTSIYSGTTKAEPLSVTPIWNFAIWMPTVPTTSTYRYKTSSIL